jgi:hypothetical protein
MIVDGEVCCTNCGRLTAPEQLGGEDTCGVCRTNERNYNAGYHEALQSMFEKVADLIEEDGGLSLVDLVCDRVQEKQREAEQRGDEPADIADLLRRFRELGAEGGL